jgi:hypothetical protein
MIQALIWFGSNNYDFCCTWLIFLLEKCNMFKKLLNFIKFEKKTLIFLD